ncbi:hypothetical protein EYZ11_010457 [Aspergillus tanneri]|uniref:Fe2OG dioxygenase domain-containing protein n=1 Tax=Aspergillus tanneri TaxID=1220188 RepID=A0A4S3J5A8_9EURO|nr:hypothetical protein EYZ11_010457 [Aspergillus tanneri]
MVRAPPIIDFGAFYTNDPLKKSDLVNQVRQACQDHGFFQIVNHGIPVDILEAIFQQTCDLFSLPLDVKERYNIGTNNRGYEHLRAQNFEKRGPGDLKEGFFIGKDIPPDHPSVLAGKFSQGPNKYPQEIRDPDLFRSVVDRYHAIMSDLARGILKVLAQTLGLPETWFDGFCHEPVATLRLLWYPAQEVTASSHERGIGAHTNFGAVTILLQDNNGGLQVWDRESSEWADVVPMPGALVVNLRNMMMRWTNDRYLSNLHRVINRSGRVRYSVPFFFSGNPDFIVECIPSCYDEINKAKYPPITVQEWMRGRYADTYGRSQEKAMEELSSEATAALG